MLAGQLAGSRQLADGGLVTTDRDIDTSLAEPPEAGQHSMAPQGRGRQVDQHAGLRRQSIQRQPQLGDGEGVELTFDAQVS